MKCPKCRNLDTRVIDSRTTEDGTVGRLKMVIQFVVVVNVKNVVHALQLLSV